MPFYERRIFPILMEKQMSKACYAKERSNALSNVKGRVLELGFGSGLNLQHYSSNVESIVAIDVNPGMDKLAIERIRASGKSVEYHCLSDKALPFDNNSFDSVVSTWTLCSIDDLNFTLKELQRVLKPGGTFFFLEHGLAQEGTLTQRLQHLLTPVQQKIGCGCRLNREMDRLIEQAGFTITQLDRYRMPGATTALASFLYRGTAQVI